MSVAREVALPPLTYQRLERGGAEVSPVRATLQMEGNIARGHVEWAATCERMVIEQPRTQAVVETRPSRPLGAAAAVGAGILGTAALTVAMAQAMGEGMCDALAEGFPSDDPAPTGDPDAGCHESHTAVAVMGVSAVALLITGIAVLATKPSVEPGAVSLGAPTPPRPVGENVACDTTVLTGLGVALYRGEERIAAASSDSSGNFALALPSALTGSLDLVVDVVPPNATLVRQGDVLGRWDALRTENRTGDAALEQSAALDVAEPQARPYAPNP
jgi:hypothetical protein